MTDPTPVASLRFRSGAYAVVTEPEPGELAAMWRAALDGAGPRAVAVTERLTGQRGQPETRRLVDLGAVEHLAVPETAEVSFPEAWKAPMPQLVDDEPPMGSRSWTS